MDVRRTRDGDELVPATTNVDVLPKPGAPKFPTSREKMQAKENTPLGECLLNARQYMTKTSSARVHRVLRAAEDDEVSSTRVR